MTSREKTQREKAMTGEKRDYEIGKTLKRKRKNGEKRERKEEEGREKR